MAGTGAAADTGGVPMGKVAGIALSPAWYGALELKRYYQKSAMLGVGLAAVIHLMIIAGFLVYRYVTESVAISEEPRILVIKSPVDLALPPSMIEERSQISVAQPEIAQPEIGIPVPVDDALVSVEPRFATKKELALLSQPIDRIGSIGAGDSVVINIPVEPYYPPRGEFVAVEKLPVPVHEEIPVFPEMAGLTGVSGVVWIEALIDDRGHVVKAAILKPSGSNVGFEEAALAAVRKNRYLPAIQNGRPVPVWISHKYEFTLKH
jgi:protein TonB